MSGNVLVLNGNVPILGERVRSSNSTALGLSQNVSVVTESLAVSNENAHVSNCNNWVFNEILPVSSETIAKLSVKFPTELGISLVEKG